MKKGKMMSLLVAGALMLGIAQMSGCSHDDTAIVTIHIQRADLLENSGVQPGLLDRLFAFFISPAYAVIWTPPSATYWLSGRDVMTVRVTGEGMGDLEVSIPPLQTQTSVQVPSGKQRRITVMTSSTNASYNGVNWGGHNTVDLNPGDEVNVSINMLPTTKITTVDAAGTGLNGIAWCQVGGISIAKGYNLYRSTSPNGPFTKLASISSLTTYYYQDYSVITGITYYYKVSVYTDTAEGEQSDYASVKAI